jgi:hypothetical protein
MSAEWNSVCGTVAAFIDFNSVISYLTQKIVKVAILTYRTVSLCVLLVMQTSFILFFLLTSFFATLTPF